MIFQLLSKIGQKAYFTVDAMNHQKFTGHVEQISPVAGSKFSVLKPDNATGNFTKVVQRISVRIAIGLIQIKKALKNYDQICL